MKPNPKSAARLSATQSYYSMLIDNNQNSENAMGSSFEILAKDGINIKRKFAKELLDFAIAEKESIQFIIKKYLETHRTIDQVNPLLLSILSVAVAELMIDKETDRPIIMNEYMKITSEFFGPQETGFVNAVLDKFTKETASK